MQEIIAPIDRDLIKKELTQEAFIRYTNNGNNEIYLVNNRHAPHVVREIGRLRELTFRVAGGGTGMALDLDDNDMGADAYDQLIAWNPEDEEIVAGYRLIKCKDVGVNSHGEINLSTAHYFHFSTKFIAEYLPYTIELGRSFVQPKYQPGKDRKGLFSLDNLWDGLGAMVRLNPDIKYLFGKVTMYPHYNREARDLLMYFMHHYFPDPEQLVRPIKPLTYLSDSETRFNHTFDGLDYKDGYKLLNSRVRALGENIPPLINTYMNLSSTMMTFGTAINDEFGTVEETGILITIDDIFESKKERHISTYERDKDFGSRHLTSG